MTADTCAVIASGGTGSRFGDARGKQYTTLCGYPISYWAIRAFVEAPSVGCIVIVCAVERQSEMEKRVVCHLHTQKPIVFAHAGATRQLSVYEGLRHVPSTFNFVAIHDGARPLIKVDTIEACINKLRTTPHIAGAICAFPVSDTLKTVDGTRIISTPNRALFWSAQTPQVFRREIICKAHEYALTYKRSVTDDASVVEQMFGDVVCVESPRDNIKITLPEDFAVAKTLLEQRFNTQDS